MVTDEDRAKARAAIEASSPEVYVDEYVIDGELPPLIETIAAALAEEREKARVPFLALADELGAESRNAALLTSMAAVVAERVNRETADAIRRAAEEG